MRKMTCLTHHALVNKTKKKDIWSQQSKTCGHNALTFFNALYDYFSQLEEAKITAL